MIKRKITEIKVRDPITERIIACSYKVHSELGYGFAENIYHNALKIALGQQGLKYQTQERFTVSYQGKDISRFKLDLIIEDKVVVEVKALTGARKTRIILSVWARNQYGKKKGDVIIGFGSP